MHHYHRHTVVYSPSFPEQESKSKVRERERKEGGKKRESEKARRRGWLSKEEKAERKHTTTWRLTRKKRRSRAEVEWQNRTEQLHGSCCT